MTVRIATATATTAALLALALLAPPAEAAPKSPAGGFDIEHCALFGDIIDQPPGSSINACCYEDGCWICDADWRDCTWDPAYSSVRPGAGAAIGQGPAVLAPAEPSRGPVRPWLKRLQGGRALR